MSSRYQMWLTYNGESEKIQMPVLPETFKVKNGSSNDSVDVTELGEITIMQGRSALQFSFSSFFPSARFPGIQVGSITSPLSLVQTINRWKEGKNPAHFICTAVGVDLYCTIESFNYEERGGDVGTYYYDIALKEYREITIRSVGISNGAATVSNEETRVDNTEAPKTYTVKAGDCLWNIAKSLCGSGSDYTKIYEANKSVVGGNPNLIYPGQVLTIP